MPEMNIVDNVALPNMALKKRNPFAKDRAVALLEAVGLGNRLEHKPLELSGGEQQRVAVARALINSPELILADEPTGNLDPATGEAILDVLFSLSSKLPQIAGIENAPPALLIVTHTQQIAEKCDRILTLEKGILK
jgi:lipoprotein-releasing system ATP-binding protein